MHKYGVVYLNRGNDLYIAKDVGYGVVYLNRGNDLYIAKDVSRMLPISSPTSL